MPTRGLVDLANVRGHGEVTPVYGDVVMVERDGLPGWADVRNMPPPIGASPTPGTWPDISTNLTDDDPDWLETKPATAFTQHRTTTLPRTLERRPRELTFAHLDGSAFSWTIRIEDPALAGTFYTLAALTQGDVCRFVVGPDGRATSAAFAALDNIGDAVRIAAHGRLAGATEVDIVGNPAGFAANLAAGQHTLVVVDSAGARDTDYTVTVPAGILVDHRIVIRHGFEGSGRIVAFFPGQAPPEDAFYVAGAETAEFRWYGAYWRPQSDFLREIREQKLEAALAAKVAALHPRPGLWSTLPDADGVVNLDGLNELIEAPATLTAARTYQVAATAVSNGRKVEVRNASPTHEVVLHGLAVDPLGLPPGTAARLACRDGGAIEVLGTAPFLAAPARVQPEPQFPTGSVNAGGTPAQSYRFGPLAAPATLTLGVPIGPYLSTRVTNADAIHAVTVARPSGGSITVAPGRFDILVASGGTWTRVGRDDPGIPAGSIRTADLVDAAVSLAKTSAGVQASLARADAAQPRNGTHFWLDMQANASPHALDLSTGVISVIADNPASGALNDDYEIVVAGTTAAAALWPDRRITFHRIHRGRGRLRLRLPDQGPAGGDVLDLTFAEQRLTLRWADNFWWPISSYEPWNRSPLPLAVGATVASTVSAYVLSGADFGRMIYVDNSNVSGATITIRLPTYASLAAYYDGLFCYIQPFSFRQPVAVARQNTAADLLRSWNSWRDWDRATEPVYLGLSPSRADDQLFEIWKIDGAWHVRGDVRSNATGNDFLLEELAYQPHVTEAFIADRAVSLNKMKIGTANKWLGYNASGAPVEKDEPVIAMTQAAYDALPVKNPNTLYVITG